MKPSTASQCGFLSLPVELRLEIYRYYLKFEQPFQLWGRAFLERYYVGDKRKFLLLINKQIGLEAHDVLYGENHFIVPLNNNGGSFLKKQITTSNQAKLRKLILIMQPGSYDIGKPSLLTTFWEPLLAHLTELIRVVAPPHKKRKPRNQKTLSEEWIYMWVWWIKKVLPWVASHLTASCVIKVDREDHHQEMTAIWTNHSLPAINAFGRRQAMKFLDGTIKTG